MKYVDRFYSFILRHRVHFRVIMMLVVLSQTAIRKLQNHALTKSNLITARVLIIN